MPAPRVPCLGAAVLATTALCVLSRPDVRAHDPGLSSLELSLTSGRIIARLSVAAVDARATTNGRTAFDAVALESIELGLDGVLLSGSVVRPWEDDPSEVRVVLAFHRKAGSRLTVRSAIPRRLASGHRQLVTVRNADGRLLFQRMLDARQDTFDVALDTATGPRGLRLWVSLGSLLIVVGVSWVALVRGSR